MNRDQTEQSLAPRYNTHFEYFQSLENRLLEESDKLTNFIDKSTSILNNRQPFKPSTSSTKVIPATLFRGRMSVKNAYNKDHQLPLQKVRELCQKFKKIGDITEKTRKEGDQHSSKDKYECYRRGLYNICSSQDLKREKPLDIEEEKTKVQNIRKNMKLLHQSQSLKDTVQSQSCKSTRPVTFLQQDNLKLDDFQIIRQLGRGRLGLVTLVRHKKTNFLCALKEIDRSLLTSDPAALVQRIREIRIQTFLDHPNIVQLYSVFVENGNLFLLMELCTDCNLYQYLRRLGSLSQDKIRSIIKQICQAVEYMHENDILHRDLKPENILFHENIVKICDFGWAVNSPLLRNTYCGSPVYTSPEIAQKQQYDNKVDIWNIGILTYELVYGRVPFEIRSEDQMQKIVEEEVYFPRSRPASPVIKDFISSCLSKNPKERLNISKLIDHQFLSPDIHS